MNFKIRAFPSWIRWDYIFLLAFLTFIESFNVYVSICAIYIVFVIYVIRNRFLIYGGVINSGYFRCLIAIFILGAVIGLLSFSNFVPRNYLRHLLIYSKPILLLLIGNYMSYDNMKTQNLKSTLILVAAFVSFLFIVQGVSNGLFQFGETSINSFREDNAISMVNSLVVGMVLIFFDSDAKEVFSKRLITVFELLFVAVFCLQFSRTAILSFALIAFPYVFEIGKNRRVRLASIAKGVLGFAILIIVLYFIIPQSYISSFFEKIIRSFTEISGDLNWSSQSVITQNWRGYEKYCAGAQFIRSNLFQQIFGHGFGYLVDVGSYSELVGVSADQGGIPTLHDGYYMLLGTNGVLGVILYASFYVLMFIAGWKSKNNSCRKNDMLLFCGIALSFLVTTMFTTGLIKSSKNVDVLLILGILSPLTWKKREYSMDKENSKENSDD